MTLPPTPYQKAFARYLRYGIPVELSLKAAAAEHPTPRYIWRTQGDDKVRPSHAANEGQIFAWDDPPPTGNPGEDYNCRCWAEPYDNDAIEPVYPELILLPIFRFGRGAIALAIRLLSRISRPKPKTTYSTEHGAARIQQRQVSAQEINDAIQSAKSNGNVVTKIGKYGTPQVEYNGANGVTVVVESEGRNAGKIITVWRR